MLAYSSKVTTCFIQHEMLEMSNKKYLVSEKSGCAYSSSRTWHSIKYISKAKMVRMSVSMAWIWYYRDIFKITRFSKWTDFQNDRFSKWPDFKDDKLSKTIKRNVGLVCVLEGRISPYATFMLVRTYKEVFSLFDT